MRFLARLGSWLRAEEGSVDVGNPRPATEGEAPETVLSSPKASYGLAFPSSSADQFRTSMLGAIDAAYTEKTANLYHLDDTIQLLVIPPAYGSSDDDEERLAIDLDRAFQLVHAGDQQFSSLTWSSLREARPGFSPSYREWAADGVTPFEGEAGLLFFVDTDSIAAAMSQHAQLLGFSTRVGGARPTVVVSDGRFEARISVNALIAEAIWTARGPLSVVRRRARALPGEFRGFMATWTGLTRRFPGVRFDLRGGILTASTGTHRGEINYRHLAASIRNAGLGVDRWLSRTVLEDILELDGDPALLLRSPSYLKAYPEVLARPAGAFATVAVRFRGERATPITTTADAPAERFDHYRDEAMRQLSFRRFMAHTFFVEQGPHAVAGFVGDAIASVALNDALVRGLVEHLLPFRERMELRCFSEDTLMVYAADTPPSLVENVQQRLLKLEEDLRDDRSDRLDYHMTADLTVHPAGHYELDLVPASYFELHDEAERHDEFARGQAHQLRGMALELLGRQTCAVREFERALRYDSQDGEANYALGRVLVAQEQGERAVPFLRRACEALPDRAEAHNAFGKALSLSGASASATPSFERAVALDPDEPEFWINLGQCYLAGYEFTKAQSTLERALTLEPSSASAHAGLALLFERRDEPTRAAHHAREAISEEPENAEMLALLHRLQGELPD